MTGEDGTHVFRLKVIGVGNLAATADVAIRVAAGPKAVEAAFAPVGGTAYAGGETIEVALHFDRAVTVDIAGGTPSVTLTVGAAPRTAGYLRGSGTGALTFGYTVQAADMDADGVDLVANSLALNGGKIAAVSDGGLAALGHAALAGGSGRTVNSPTAGGICDRTAAVQTAILARVRADENDASLQCGDIGPVRLVAIGGRLDLSAQARNGRMTALKAGDFAWLANVTVLDLDNHALRSFPAGIFDPLTALSELSIAYNQTQAADRLTSLPAGLFDRLTKLTTLRLEHNDLETLPDGIFEKLTRLTTLTLHGNPGSAAFLPVAAAGPAGGLEAETGERVTLGGDAGGPWGGNVVHAWRQVSGTAVALSATDAAKPAFAAPALAGPEDLAFELTVTGRGTSLTATDRVSVRIAAAAAVSSVVPASTPIDGDTYRRGETIGIAVGFAKPVTVTGTPQLALSVGTNTRQAAYVRGSGTGQLVFEYPVVQADADSDGIAIAADSLAPGTGAIADATGMAALLGHPALAAQAAHRVDGSLTHAFNPMAGICGRTAPVRDGLLLAVRARTGDTALGCAQVTTTHLGALSGTLILAHKGIGTLKPGDFANLGGIAALQLDNNDLQTIPAGVFDRLTGLTTLSLHDNRLPSLPDRIFEGLMKLTQLSLNGNPGTADFKPTAMAGPEGGIDVPQGATTGITLGVEVPENGYDDPWGTNVTYAWSRTEGTGGTLTDATAAQAVFTPPATDGTHAFRLTVTGGGGVAGTSTVSVHVGAAGVPPMPVSAVVNGPTLTLTYSKNLQAEPPPASDSGKGQVYLAVVSVPGVRRNIEPVPPSAVEVMGRQVILTFKPSIDPNRVVTLSYFPDNATAESRIRDRGGNLAGAFAGFGVRNETPEGPTVVNIAIRDPAKTYRIGDTVGIDVTFSDPVAVTVTGGAPTLALEIGSANRKARWKAGQAAGAVQRFEYTVAEGEEDTDGIAVKADGLAVPSRSSILTTAEREAVILGHGRVHDPAHKVDGVRPTASSARSEGPGVSVIWSEPLDTGAAPAGAGGFTVNVPGAANPVVTAVTISGSVVNLALNAPIALAATGVTVNYTPAATPIRDAAGNAAERFESPLAVTVAVDETPPALTAAAVNGDTLTLTYSEPLKATSPAAAAYSVGVSGGGTFTLSNIRAGVGPGNTQVVMTLDPPAQAGQTIRVAYMPNNATTATKVQDLAGNAAAGFASLSELNPPVTLVNMTGAPTLTLSKPQVTEGDDAQVTLTLSTGNTTYGSARTFTISAGADSTALQGQDWTLSSASVVLPAGKNSVTATLAIVDDARLEPAETASFKASLDGGAETAAAVLAIADDDKAVLAVRGPDGPVTEGQPIELTLRLEPHPENVANLSAVPDDACILDFPVTATLTRAGDTAAALPSNPTLETDHSFAATSFDDCTREVTVSVPTKAPDAVWMADRALTFALAPKNSDPRVEAGEALSAAVRDDTPEGNTVQSFAVTGAPTLALEIGAARRKAAYVGGSGSAVLTFEATEVALGEEDTDGIAVAANGLEVPVGRSILNTVDREAAILRHGRYHDPAYKVDGVLPAATAASAAGPTVTVTWSEALDPASLPTGAGGFRVRIGSGCNANGPAVSAVAVSGPTTTLSLASAIADGTANVKLEYSPLSGAKIRDAAGNDAAAIPRDDALAVTVTPDQRAPEVSGTPTVDGTTLTLTFDEALDTASVPPAPGGFTVTVTRVDDAVPGHTVTGIAVSGATVTLTLAKGVLPGDTVTLDYVPTSTRLQDRAVTPNPVAGFSGLDMMKTVDNASDALEVSLSTTEAVEGDDGTVTLTVAVAGGGTSGVARAIAIAPVASPTAAETEDWTLPAGQRSLTLGAGQRSVSAAISVVDDARLEDAETVSFAVTADGAAIGQVTLTIADDDKAVLAVRGPAQVTEGQPIELTLRLEPHPENVANVSAVPDDACILDFPVTATLTRAGDIAAALPSNPTLETDHSFAATSFDDCTREVTVSVPTRAPDAVWMADRALTFALAPKNSDPRVEAGEAGEALSAAVRDDTPLPGPMVTGISISPGARTCDRPDPVNPSGYTKEEFLALPGCAVHGRGTTLTFTLTFDSAVTVTRNAQTRALPELVLDVFGRERRAQLSGNRTDTGTLTFTWTVAKGDNDPDGIGVARIDLKGASIRFAAGCMENLPCDIDVPTFKSDHAQTYPKHRVRGGLHAMRLSVSGSAREGEPFTVTVRRDGGYKETAHAIVRMTDSGMESPGPGEASVENHGVRLMSFPFDADPEQGPDSRVSVQTVTPPGDGVADARTLTFKMFATDVGDSGVSYWYVTRDPVEATVTVTDTGLAGGTPDGPSLGVWDDWTREPTQEQWDRGRRFPLRFDVTVPWPNVLRPRGEAKVTVQYETRDGTATVADRDYVATRGTLTFEAGETRKTVVVEVRPDRHDEGEETMTLVLSSATGAAIARAEAVGTIRNNGPIPKAWIARFGRTVAEQVLEAIEGRMRAAPVPGAEVALAGERIGAQSPDRGPDRAEPGSDAEREARQEEEARRDTQRLAGWLKGETDPEEAQRLRSRAVTPRDLLTGSSFALTAETDGGDLVSLWGRGTVTRFDGREGDLMLDGEVVTGMLGADWTGGRWTAGLIVSHSTAEGGYSGAPVAGDAGSGGKVEATLTGLFPWARHALSERLEAWGAAGYGAGELTVTPKAPGTGGDGPAIHADLDLRMAAAGLRGTILDGGADGLTLIGKIDAMAVQTASGRGRGTDGGNLEPARATVTRLRLGVEASRPVGLGGGAALTPSLEIGVRHDGGDAETGFGLDLGGGLALSDPKRGLQAELRGRGLLTHESKGFRDLGFSGSLAWEGNPGSDRGAKLRLTQTVGGSSSGGADALLSRTTMEGLAANDDGEGGDDELKSRRLELKFGYGLSAFGDRFTWTPEVGVDLSDTGRDYSLGWRLVRGAGSGGDGGSLDLSFEATRRESANDDTPPVHEVGLRLTARF